MINLQEINSGTFKVGVMTLQRGDFDILYYSIYGDIDSINIRNKHTSEFIFPHETHYSEFTSPFGNFSSLESLGVYLGSISYKPTSVSGPSAIYEDHTASGSIYNVINLQDVDQGIFKVGTTTLQKGDFDILYYSIYDNIDSINIKNKYTNEFAFPDKIHYSHFTSPSGSFSSLEDLGVYLGNIISKPIPSGGGGSGSIDSSSFATTGSNTFHGNQTISGSVSITGPLYATASNAISASYAATASYATNTASSSYSVSSSTVPWSGVTNTPTTSIGYGITDVLHTTGNEIKEGNLTLINELLLLNLSEDLTADVSNVGINNITNMLVTLPIDESLVVQVTNKTGVTILKGSVVYVNGAQGSRPTVALSLADEDEDTSQVLGIVKTDIVNNASGYVVVNGIATGLNTTPFLEGDFVYLSDTIPGALTTTVPTSPNHRVLVGTITRQHGTQGSIIVMVRNAIKLDELSDVVATTPLDNDVLTYESGSGLWKNENIISVIGYTPENITNKGIPDGYAPLDGNNKVPLIHINDALIGNVKWKGLYNGTVISSSPDSSLNGQPLPAPAIGNIGWYFISNGTYTNGGNDYVDGDWIISNGVTWGKVDNTDAVSTVFGRTGHIVATNGDYNADLITETASRVFVTPAQKAQIHDALTLGTPSGLSLLGQQLSLGLSSTSTTGALSSTDWNTFNNKSVVVPAPLTKVDDTNVTLSLGGSPSNALLQSVSLTLGWTGTLADSRIFSAAVWHSKQNSLGFIPENTDNKQNSLDADGTGVFFPTVDAVNTIKERVEILESLQDLSTNFTGQAYAVWTGVGLIYDVIYPNYYIEGIPYPGATESLTLDVADSINPRQDVIAVDATGAIKKTGIASPDPAALSVDTQTEIYIATVFIAAGATTPTGVIEEVIYKENTEWTTSSTNGTVNFNATSTPFQGTKHIDCGAFTNNQYLSFVDSSSNQITDFNILNFRLNLKGTFSNNTYFTIQFYNGTTLIGSKAILSGENNFLRTTINTYQQIVLSLNEVSFLSSTFNSIRIVMVGNNSSGYRMDNIILSKGESSSSPLQKAITTIVTDSGTANSTINDDVFTIKGGGGAVVSAVGKVITVTPPIVVEDSITNGITDKAPSQNAVYDALLLKLDTSAYNQHFKGKYTSSAALITAYPTAVYGDYAIVDAGVGSDAKEWIWDNEVGWIIGGAAGATTTDALPEGSTNLYFTSSRVLSTILSGLSSTSGTFTSSDTLINAFGKIKYLIDNISSIYQVILTETNFGAFINGLTSKTTPVDADVISLSDSGDSNKQKKVSLTNFKSFLKTYFDTQYQLKGVRVTNTTTTGTYNIDWNSGDVFQLTLTGTTTLVDLNLPTGTSTKVIELMIKGSFSWTPPSYWEAVPSSQTYNGAKWNHVIVSCINGTSSFQKVIYSNEPLAT